MKKQNIILELNLIQAIRWRGMIVLASTEGNNSDSVSPQMDENPTLVWGVIDCRQIEMVDQQSGCQMTGNPLVETAHFTNL